jgi:predicted dehydrogenase
MPRNIALVGCGAIAQAFYLSALAKRREDFDQLWFVDPSDRALDTASAAIRSQRVHRLSDIAADVQFVVVATPNSLHFPLGQEALARGAHVLMEKPFVIWPEEGRKLAETATKYNRVLAINQTRRFFPYAGDLRTRIAAGEFGLLKSVVHLEGGKLVWPFESGAAFAKTAQRTGVIMDLGPHVLDFYHYILQPNWAFVSTIHDGFDGPEGLAEIEMMANGAPVSLRLSRYQRQENVARLMFENGEVIVNIFDWNSYSFKDKMGVIRRFPLRPAVATYDAFAEPLLSNFIAAGEGRGTAACDAAGSLPVIELLDAVYRGAQRYPIELGAV